MTHLLDTARQYHAWGANINAIFKGDKLKPQQWTAAKACSRMPCCCPRSAMSLCRWLRRAPMSRGAGRTRWVLYLAIAGFKTGIPAHEVEFYKEVEPTYSDATQTAGGTL